jgi:hypothetical protein
MPAERVPTFPPLAPPQQKVPGRKPVPSFPADDFWPTPHYRISEDALADPMFAPPPPKRGYWLHAEIPPYKIRGLGPSDSIILRTAISRGMFNVNEIVLTPLVPWTPPRDPAGAVSRDLTICPDAPLQPDMAVNRNDKRILIEIKPNAGYAAFGQILAYVWNWNRHFGATHPARGAILTDQPRLYLVEMLPLYDLDLYALGDLIVEPPPFPT